MTRIFTNVPSLTAQRSLQSNMASLSTSLQRLSTGLRINSGKDDPAGLIASEILRSEITGIKQGITNTSRANNMIATADSALNEIAGLLNDIRALVNEAANTGAMSQEMLKANQTQVDDMLKAIDRISTSTTFMGRKLLDGSLDFEIQGVTRTEIQNLSVTEAQFGDKGTIDVQVTLREAAEKAALYYAHSYAQTDFDLTVGGNLGQVTQSFKQGASVEEIANFVNGTSSTTGVMAEVMSDATYGALVTSSVGPNNDILIHAGAAGSDAGFVEIKYTYGNDRGLVVDFQESLGPGYPATINVQLQTTAWESARATHVDSTAGVHDNNSLEFIANIAGDKFNGVTINYVDGNLVDENFSNPNANTSGISRGVNTEYSETGTAATALLGDVNGLRAFENLGAGDYIKLIANKAGSELNNVRIEFLNDTSRYNIPSGQNAGVSLVTEKDAEGKDSQVLKIYVDATPASADQTATTFADIRAAVEAEGTFRMSYSNAEIAKGFIDAKDCAVNTNDPNDPLNADAVYGNTSNSGSDAKTLLVYLNTEDVPAYMGLDYKTLSLTAADFKTGLDGHPTETVFGVGDPQFSITTSKAGFNDTKISFELATIDKFSGAGMGNVFAKYDDVEKTLKVYINSGEDFVPPTDPASNFPSVTFAEIAAAIESATAVNSDFDFDPGTFQVTHNLLESNGSTNNTIGLADISYPQPNTIDFASGEQIQVLDKTGNSFENVNFVAVDANSPRLDGQSKVNAVYDEDKKSITVYVDSAALPTFGEIDTALQGLTVNGVADQFKLHYPDTLVTSNTETFVVTDATWEYTLNKGTDLSIDALIKDGPDGNVALTTTFDDPVHVSFVTVKNDERSLLLPGQDIGVKFDNCIPHTLTVYVRDDGSGNAMPGATLETLQTLLQNTAVPTSDEKTGTGYFDLTFTDDADKSKTFNLDNIGNTGYPAYDGTSKGIEKVLYGVHNANDIKNAFDLDRLESRGNERAAGFFTVYRSRDNDGTGAIHSAEFKNALTGGQDGGEVLNTAQEVVAALNNSKYWGTEMSQEQLQEWYANQTAEFRTDPPVITASLAPNNHGLNTVTVFSEVAYYGNPYEGTGIQFLGPDNSAPIRFVASKEPNSPLSIDWESIPDKVDYATAILTATNANASIVIQGKQVGEVYDDTYFRFVRVEEDPGAEPPITRGSGWGEYDSGPSYAEALLTFSDSATGNPVDNTAFTITANDRGEDANNVNITMRQNANQAEDILVTFDPSRNELQISLKSSELGKINARNVIEAINKDSDGDGLSDCGFNADLSYALNANNNGSGTFEHIGLTTIYSSIGNTADTGGHTGTVTIYLVGEGAGHLDAPTANQVIDIIQNDDILSTMFSASTYSTGAAAGTGAIDFVKDTGIVTENGIVERGTLVVNLATDATGAVITTAADLVAFWDTLSYEEARGISASLLREPGTIWDECNDDAGQGILPETPIIGDDCDFEYLDTYFVGWSDSEDEPMEYIPGYASGTMTSINGEDSSFSLIARKTGDAYNGYTLAYSEDLNLTGSYDDNKIGPEGAIEYKGLRVAVDNETKKITVYIREGITTANDVKQLIESNPLTKQLFEVELNGTGNGKVTLRDDTLLTKGGTEPPSSLNGAKLLFGRDATEYALKFISTEYGSSQYVSVIASNGTFNVVDNNGNQVERAYGTDADVLVNGVKAVADGQDVTLSTSTLSMSFTLNDNLEDGYTSNFSILGGGATFQIGAQVVASQQITIGIPAVTTNSLGGVSGRLYQLGMGQNASLLTDSGTKLADKIVQEAIVSVTQIRGRLGSLQANTFEPNSNVLSDTLEALSTAESEIRDTDFAEETSNMTRAQVLVQASINTLGIANQLPNYILGLLGG